MANVISISFDGGNNTALQTYNSSLSKINAGDGDMIITSNRARTANSVTASGYVHATTPPSANYSVSVDLVYLSSVSNNQAHVLGRYTDLNNYYYARFLNGTGVSLFKVTGGSFSQLGSTSSQTPSVNNTYNLKLEMIGSAIKVFWAGSQLISQTDSSVTATGKAAFRESSGSALSNTTGIHLDNFSVDTPESAVSTLTDNFDDNSRDTAKWNTGNPYGAATAGATPSETNNRLEIQIGASTNAYSGFLSVDTFTLTGSSAYVKLVQALPNQSGYETPWNLYLDGSNLIGFNITGGNIRADRMVTGTVTSGWTATYDPSVHTWLRVRESGGTTYWDTAPSSASNPPIEGDWVNRFSIANPIATTGLRVNLGAGSSTTNVASANSAIYDGFNTAASSSGVTANLSKTLNATTVSSDFDTSIAAGLSKTLTATTSSSDFDTSIAADLAKTLGATTLSSTATLVSNEITADLSKTLSASTVSSDFDTFIAADLSKTLSASTVSSDFDTFIAADLSKTLSASTVSSDFDTSIAAGLSKTLSASTVSSDFDTFIAADLSKTLSATTVVSDTDLSISADLTKTLQATTLESTFSYQSGANLDYTLSPTTSLSSASIDISADSEITLQATTSVSDAALSIEADLSVTLQPTTLFAEGGGDGLYLSLTATLQPTTVQSTSSSEIASQLDSQLTASILDSSTVIDVTADLSQTLLATTLFATIGDSSTTADLDVQLQPVILSSDISIGILAELSKTLNQSALLAYTRTTDVVHITPTSRTMIVQSHDREFRVVSTTKLN